MCYSTNTDTHTADVEGDPLNTGDAFPGAFSFIVRTKYTTKYHVELESEQTLLWMHTLLTAQHTFRGHADWHVKSHVSILETKARGLWVLKCKLGHFSSLTLQ